MSSRRSLSLWALFLLNGLCPSACTIRIGPYEGDGMFAEDDGLPAPDNATTPPPVLTPEQAARQAEADAYIQALYKDCDIAATKQGPSGDVFDWVRPKVPEIPLELPILPFPTEDLVLPEGIAFPQSEIELFPELVGPEGTTPLLRPDFSVYVMGETGASSLQDYLDNHQVFGLPAGIDRLYAGMDVLEPNHGVMAVLNHYAGSVEDQTFSVAEVAVACPAVGPVEELIGVVLSIDRVNFGGLLDDEQAQKVRLHVEMARTDNGQLQGAWDTRGGYFKPNLVDQKTWPAFLPLPKRTALGGQVTVSEVDGPQREHLLQIFQVPNQEDWWIAYRGELMGHVPGNLFTQLNKGACRAHTYGEVYNGTPGPWTITDMGSGEFAEAGPNRASYFRRMMILNAFWGVQDVTETVNKPSDPHDNGCYSRTDTEDGGPLAGFFFLFSGPGFDSPLCK